VNSDVKELNYLISAHQLKFLVRSHPSDHPSICRKIDRRRMNACSQRLAGRRNAIKIASTDMLPRPSIYTIASGQEKERKEKKRGILYTFRRRRRLRETSLSKNEKLEDNEYR
jgi:hypothetical protein